MKFRYLDSLDSIRYSQTEFIDMDITHKNRRIHQATIETMVTLLMGNGIQVPNNQVMDSWGFLSNMYEIVDIAASLKKKGEWINIPIIWAKYNYAHETKDEQKLADPFSLVAYLFEKDDPNLPGYFELSSWPNFNSERRRVFAKLLRGNMLVPRGFYQNSEEEQLVDYLLHTLKFFTDNRNLLIKANPTSGIRQQMCGAVANLTEDKIENDKFFKIIIEKGPSENRLKTLMDIVGTFTKLKSEGKIDYRGEVRSALAYHPEQYLPSDDPISARKGVLKTFNSIYNYSGFKSTTAEQDNQTEAVEPDKKWGYDEAAFTIGQWAREEFEGTKKNSSSKSDISSNQNSFVREDVPPRPNGSRDILEEFFKQQKNPKWDQLCKNYQQSIRNFEEAKKGNIQRSSITKSKLEDSRCKYQDSRLELLNYINQECLPSNACIDREGEKVFLKIIDFVGETKIQIEDFAEEAELSKEEKSSNYAAIPSDEDVTGKSRTAEYGEDPK